MYKVLLYTSLFAENFSKFTFITIKLEVDNYAQSEKILIIEFSFSKVLMFLCVTFLVWHGPSTKPPRWSLLRSTEYRWPTQVTGWSTVVFGAQNLNSVCYITVSMLTSKSENISDRRNHIFYSTRSKSGVFGSNIINNNFGWSALFRLSSKYISI